MLVHVVVDPDDPYKLTDDTRQLGLVVCRGTSVVLICPVDGMESISNPFVAEDGWFLLKTVSLCSVYIWCMNGPFQSKILVCMNFATRSWLNPFGTIVLIEGHVCQLCGLDSYKTLAQFSSHIMNVYNCYSSHLMMLRVVECF